VIQDCLFCRIAGGEVDAHRVLATDDAVGFLDVRPVFPGHVLVVPRTHYETLMDMPTAALEPLWEAVQRIGRALENRDGLAADGVFVGVNNRISQSVPHVHVHVIPRRRKDGLRGFFWPRQKYASDDEAAAIADRIRASVREP
jgi:histidine triad (HIT) family protein